MRSWKRAHTAVRDIGLAGSGLPNLHTHYPGLRPTTRQSASPRGCLLPWPGVDTRSPGEIRRAACLLSGLAPRAGGWRRRKSPHVGTSPRDTVAAGVACPLYPHEKAGGGLSLLSTFSQIKKAETALEVAGHMVACAWTLRSCRVRWFRRTGEVATQSLCCGSDGSISSTRKSCGSLFS